MEALKKSAVLHIGMYGSWSHESTAEKSVGFSMGELSTEVRQQAEHFLKGAKPTESTNKKLPNHYDKVSIGEVPDILWVIPAFKRAWSLDLVLKSLASQNNILVSKDADSDEIDSVLKKYSADVISHPWSCSRHPNQFPAKDESLNENYKGDTYGNPRSPWATCLKHHWWWMMKQAWARKPERVCVLEDDTVIHPQAFEWLASHSGNVKLTPEEIAVPWCMSAKEWQTIEPKAFCEHDDYNWDQTIAWMKEHGHGQNEASVPSVSLSMHVGDCGGWDAGGRDKACTPQKIVKIHANVEHWLGKSIPVHIVKRKWLTAHSKPNGGWGHPKDWAHCLGNDESKPFGMHFLERLEYYLPNRDYLFPTDVKSIEKKILTFDIPNHVSITFDAPVENIAISTKNWPEKHKTQCPNCEFVNDRSATVKWVPGCPSNPRKDYKEQILVCSCGESQKGTG
jgi:glycosyltransferase involved in cell wall biosynthesis